jgi:hypothetical protein
MTTRIDLSRPEAQHIATGVRTFVKQSQSPALPGWLCVVMFIIVVIVGLAAAAILL